MRPNDDGIWWQLACFPEVLRLRLRFGLQPRGVEAHFQANLASFEELLSQALPLCHLSLWERSGSQAWVRVFEIPLVEHEGVGSLLLREKELFRKGRNEKLPIGA